MKKSKPQQALLCRSIKRSGGVAGALIMRQTQKWEGGRTGPLLPGLHKKDAGAQVRGGTVQACGRTVACARNPTLAHTRTDSHCRTLRRLLWWPSMTGPGAKSHDRTLLHSLSCTVEFHQHSRWSWIYHCWNFGPLWQESAAPGDYGAWKERLSCGNR